MSERAQVVADSGVAAALQEANASRRDLADAFVQEFEVMAEAGAGVGTLRQLVIDLAVRGLLVEQRGADGSGSALARAMLDARRRSTTGRTRLGGDDDAETSQEPFTIPGSWALATVGQLTVKLGAGSTPLGGKSVYKQSGVKFLRSQNVWNDGLRLADVAYIDREIHEQMSGTHVQPGDILLNITGASIGRTAVVPDSFDDANVSQHVAIVRLVDKSVRRFVHLAMTATYFQQSIMNVQVGVSREGLSMKKLQYLPVPVPPLAEQKRIVAKVDQLMALCDELEARQARKREVGARLTKSALEALAMAETPEDLGKAWQRVEANVDVLVATSQAVRELRPTLLDLAVLGRLTQGKRGVGASAELPPLPQGWRWEECADLCDPERSITYGVIKLGAEIPDGVPTLRSSNVRWLRLNEEGVKRIAPALAAEFRRTELRGGEVVVTVRGTLGGVAVVPQHLAGANVSREVAVLPFRSDHSPAFMSLCVAAPRSQRWFASVTKGIAYEGINIGDLKRLPLPVPPIEEQLRIVQRVERLMKMCDDLEAGLRLKEDRASRLVEAMISELVA